MKSLPAMIDVTAPPTIDIQIRGDGKVIWIHTDADGFPPTVLRACRIGKLTIRDERADAHPSYNELVRALAFTFDYIDGGPDNAIRISYIAQLESARKLLLRAQAAQ